MPRRRTNRRMLRRRSRRPIHSYVEVIPFSLTVGTTTSILVSTLMSLPHRHNFRPISIRVVCVGGFVPTNASSSRAGFYAPAGISVSLNDPRQIVANSLPVLLGPNPVQAHVRYPKSADWFAWNVAGNTVIAQLTGDCLGQPSSLGHDTAAFIRGYVYLSIQYGPELIDSTCPASRTLLQSNSEADWEDIDT